MCKSCLLKIINKKNSLEIFKNILIDKKIPNKTIDNKNKKQVNLKINNYKSLKIFKILKNNEQKINQNFISISEKHYDELEDILNNLLQDIYKFILIIHILNKQKYENLFKNTNVNLKIFSKYVSKLIEELTTNLKLFIDFSENYDHLINEILRIHHIYSEKLTFSSINYIFSIKIENKKNYLNIKSNIEKFLKYSKEFLYNINN